AEVPCRTAPTRPKAADAALLSVKAMFSKAFPALCAWRGHTIIDAARWWEKTEVMQHYRLYHLGPTGRIVSARDLECPDDPGALERAEREREHHNVELWQDIRL